MSHDIANRGEILLYDITVWKQFDRIPCTFPSLTARPSDTSRENNMSCQFELNKALFEAVTACFDYHIDLSTCTNIPNGLQNATLTIRAPKSQKIVWTLSI